jgi:hypothetical protein
VKQYNNHIWWLLLGLVGWWLFPQLLTAQEPLVAQEIRYRLPLADEVTFLWGVNGWEMAPEAWWPPGTTVANQVMSSPMLVAEGDFVVTLHVPPGTTIDYGFLVTKTSEGEMIEAVWDGDYVLIAQGEPVRALPPASVITRLADSGELEGARLGRNFLFAIILILLVVVVVAWARPSTTEDAITIRVNGSPRGWDTAVRLIVLGNLFFLAGAAWFNTVFYNLPGEWAEAPPAVRHLLVQFSLSGENVLAVWYSSKLLLLTAVLALLSFFVDWPKAATPRDRLLTAGWLALSFMFALLSLDELGTLHEAIGELALLNPFGERALGWVVVLAIPIAVVAALMFAFTWLHLRPVRRAFLLFALGIILFLTIPLQEIVEEMLLRRYGQRPLWGVLLEEGAELFASLAFFSAIAVYLAQAAGGSFNVRLNRKGILMGTAVFTLVGGGLMLFLEWVSPYLAFGSQFGVDGIPANWFSSMAAALAALLAWHIGGGSDAARRPYFALAVTAVIFSGYYGSNTHGYLYQTWREGGGILGAHVLMLGTAAFWGAFLFQRLKSGWEQAGAIGWLLLLAGSLFLGQGAVAPLAFIAWMLLVALLLSHLAHASLAAPHR